MNYKNGSRIPDAQINPPDYYEDDRHTEDEYFKKPVTKIKQEKTFDMAWALKVQNPELDNISSYDLSDAIEKALEIVGVEIIEKAEF